MAGAPRPRAALIGLTGAVAAGKSAALEAFARLGARTISADAIVHELLGTDRVRELLVERWGPEVAPGGEVDRNRVGAIVFEDGEELRWLEATLHPLVAERIATWVAGLPASAEAVVEVPLLFETGMESSFDVTVCVIAREATRAARAGARGTAALAERGARQLSQEEKAARATYVVRNDGTLAELEAELTRVLADLRARRVEPAEGDG